MTADAPDLLELSEKLAAAAEFQDQGGEAAAAGLLPGAVPWALIWKFVEQCVNAYLEQHGLKPPA